MTTNNTHKTDIHTPTEFEPANPERERSQTPALDRSATGIGLQVIYCGTVPEHVMEPSTNLPILSSNGCEWSALPQHSLSARRCAVQRGCGDFGEDKTSSLPEIERIFYGHPAPSLATIPAHACSRVSCFECNIPHIRRHFSIYPVHVLAWNFARCNGRDRDP
jgi:hypothetical protein